ncbi:MAG: HAMP domain-containing sensor histidine kinase [Anaerorhabdus sp.]|uniref:HAMP domain-containing sensor histidine kinase n=2 Tax=Anaerorhabdus sp. TaxID=1872524 RepID=UPI002FCC824D
MRMWNKLSFKITILMITAFLIVLSIQLKQGVNNYIDNYITMNSMLESTQFIDTSPIILYNEVAELYKTESDLNDVVYSNYIESKASIGNHTATTQYYILNNEKKVIASSKREFNYLVIGNINSTKEFFIESSSFTKEEKILIAKSLKNRENAVVKVAGVFGTKNFYYKAGNSLKDVYGNIYVNFPSASQTKDETDFDYSKTIDIINPTYLEINGIKIRDGLEKNMIKGVRVLGYQDEQFRYTQCGVDNKFELVNKIEVFDERVDKIVNNRSNQIFYKSNGSISLQKYIIDKEYYYAYIIPITEEQNRSGSVDEIAKGYLVKITYYPNIKKEMIKMYLKDNVVTYVIALLSAIIISIFCAKIIVKPIKKIERISKKIADKNFDEKITTKDKTEIGSLSNSINEMSAQLETTIGQLEDEINRVKKLEIQRKEFIANFTHEMKTPLAIINGYSELLEEATDDEKKRCYLSIIDEETNKIDKLIKAMLMLSKLELNKVQLDIQEIDIERILNQCIDSMSVQLQEKKAKVSMTCSIGKWFCDKEQMQSVIMNLISNAVRHVEMKGTIYIILNDEILSIENEGNPISEERLTTIWDAFQSGTSEGTGLGLAICKNILDLHGFKYTVENTEIGVRFKIYFNYNNR